MPPAGVLAAFGLAGDPVLLAGGEGRTYALGDVILKPVDDADEAAWCAGVLAAVEERGFRTPRPIRSDAGEWLAGGWTAWTRIAGEHAPCWDAVVEAGEAFHDALRDVKRPAFIARRANPWSIADRVAWGEVAPAPFLDTRHLARLLAARRPLALPSQVVHGDLSGNVLVAAGLAPAVIDFTPYWRPPGWALACVVCDALLWWGADATVLDLIAHVAERDQLFLRALIYRAVTDGLHRREQPARDDEADVYAPVVALALERCHGTLAGEVDDEE